MPGFEIYHLLVPVVTTSIVVVVYSYCCYQALETQ